MRMVLSTEVPGAHEYKAIIKTGDRNNRLFIGSDCKYKL